MIAASLLLLLEEEDAFWIMVTIVEDLLPASYYSSTLIGRFLVKKFTNLKHFFILFLKRYSSRPARLTHPDHELLA